MHGQKLIIYVHIYDQQVFVAFCNEWKSIIYYRVNTDIYSCEGHTEIKYVRHM